MICESDGRSPNREAANLVSFEKRCTTFARPRAWNIVAMLGIDGMFLATLEPWLVRALAFRTDRVKYESSLKVELRLRRIHSLGDVLHDRLGTRARESV